MIDISKHALSWSSMRQQFASEASHAANSQRAALRHDAKNQSVKTQWEINPFMEYLLFQFWRIGKITVEENFDTCFSISLSIGTYQILPRGLVVLYRRKKNT